MFHVKHPQGECSVHTCMDIAEPQGVGHEVSKHAITSVAKYACIFYDRV